MAKKKKNSRENDGAALDMTPMIDVVFQLIIFFVVTLKTADTVNPDIVLEYGKNGPNLKELLEKNKSTPPVTIEVKTYHTPMDVARRLFAKDGAKVHTGCVISMNGAVLSESQLLAILKRVAAERGTGFPVLIRADQDANHSDVRRVMDTCARAGLWKLSFVAMIKPGEGPKQ